MSVDPNEKAYQAKATWHAKQAKLPLQEKIRILLELQRQYLTLIAKHRKLKWYERPWPVTP